MINRVALVAYHTRANLNTWFNCPAEMWVRNGYEVDVIVPKSEMHLKFGFRQINGKVFYVCDGGRRFRWELFRFVVNAVRVCKQRKYDCLIGFGQKGMIFAGIMSVLLKMAFVYQSLELEPSQILIHRILKWLEKAFNKRALLTVIQDEKRARVLAEKNGINRRRIIAVPNSTLGYADGSKSNYLRDRFKISAEKKIVFYSGSLADETMSADIIRSVRLWSEKFVLVMLGWADARYKEKLRSNAREYSGRVYLSFDLLPYEKVDLLFRSAEVGLALYDYHSSSPNIIHVGQAAGKVFQYFRFGVPSIVTDLPGLRELVCNDECGVCIDDISSIGAALEKIVERYNSYRENSLKAFSKYEFSGHYQKVIDYLQQDLI
jgi:glycosyltransferase involved in cell wall biosynthesis